MGTEFLTRLLNKILVSHIQRVLPELRTKIQELVQQYDSEARSYGPPVGDVPNRGALLLHFLTKFCNDFRAAIDGTTMTTPRDELFGGARVSYIFHDEFDSALMSIDPMNALSDVDIRTAIRNSAGPSPSLFVPEAAFEQLVRSQITRLETPAKQCVDLVFEELLRIVEYCKSQREYARFPRVSERIGEIVVGYLRQRLLPTQQMVSAFIRIQTAYLKYVVGARTWGGDERSPCACARARVPVPSTSHPDFIGGGKAMAQVMQDLQGEQMARQEAMMQAQMAQQQRMASNSRAGSLAQPSPPPPQAPPPAVGGFMQFFFGGRDRQRATRRSTAPEETVVLQQPPPTLQPVVENVDRDRMEAQLIRTRGAGV